MPKLESIEDLKQLRDHARRDMRVRTKTDTQIIVGMGPCGVAAGARETMHAILQELHRQGIHAHVLTADCIGLCSKEPLVAVEQAGRPQTVYCNVSPSMVSRLIEEHLRLGRIVEEWAMDNVAGEGIGWSL